MTNEFGIRHMSVSSAFDTKNDVWMQSEEAARDIIKRLGGPRVLIAREVGEPFEVKDLPKTQGTVGRATVAGVRVTAIRADNSFVPWFFTPSTAEGICWASDNDLVGFEVLIEAEPAA